MKQLYKISEDYQGLMELVESGEVTTDMIADTLEGVQGMFEEKANAVVTIANQYERNLEMVQYEIDRLTAMKKALQGQRDSLKEYLRENMERTGITKIECPLFKITLRKATQTCEVLSEVDLPDDYVSVKTTIAPDKRKILADLKAGKEIPGAILATGKTSILIK
jgi:predicted transcriptional regulator